jgi:hypothetical protein
MAPCLVVGVTQPFLLTAVRIVNKQICETIIVLSYGAFLISPLRAEDPDNLALTDIIKI